MLNRWMCDQCSWYFGFLFRPLSKLCYDLNMLKINIMDEYLSSGGDFWLFIDDVVQVKRM